MALIKKSRFFRHLVFYGGFVFLNRGLSFLLVPLFTRYLTPEDYGIYALFLTAVLICEPLLTFCVSDAIGYVYYNPRYNICEYVSTLMVFYAGTFVLQMACLGGGVFFFALPLWLLCVPVAALSSIVTGALNFMWQLKEKPLPYGQFNFCHLLSQLLLQVGATVFLRLGWRGVVGAQVLLALLTIPLALVLLKKNGWLGLGFHRECLRFGLKFGMGLIPNAFAARFNDSIGKLFISQTFDLTETGIYAAGQKLGAIVNVYNFAFGSTYRPWLFKKLTGGGVAREARKIVLSVPLAFTSTLLFAWGGSLCMYLFSGFVLGRNFSGALIFVFWSASAYALNGMYNVVSHFIYQSGKPWILSLLSVSAVGLNALFTWRFLRTFGMIGAAYAPVLAWGVTLALSIVAALRLWRGKL
ncbi:MAG: lipopolysaccharide biosynthesis protein [Synergistaceae bacterium]|jgi:O-antigen/teichoic acid export membrane protein|nr:lipopolysaccharide biosynthesis protein [Synergistaceae bacterium]